MFHDLSWEYNYFAPKIVQGNLYSDFKYRVETCFQNYETKLTITDLAKFKYV